MSSSSTAGLLRTIAARVRIAIAEPQPEPFPIGLFRTFLLKRRIFDIASLIVQLKDIPRLAGIAPDIDGDDPNAAAYAHNAGVLLSRAITKTRRMEDVYRIVAVVRRKVSDATLLCVGPRNVHELLLAWLYGFTWRNIRGIDLYSTNPKIQVMDMEKMTFPDASFDVVVMSRTLSYAKDVGQCIGEVARVLKPGGLFCFTATFAPGLGRFPNDRVSGAETVSHLKDNGFRLRFYEPGEKINTAGLRQARHVFCVSKADPAAPPFDPVEFLGSPADRSQSPSPSRGAAPATPNP